MEKLLAAIAGTAIMESGIKSLGEAITTGLHAGWTAGVQQSPLSPVLGAYGISAFTAGLLIIGGAWMVSVRARA